MTGLSRERAITVYIRHTAAIAELVVVDSLRVGAKACEKLKG